MKKYKEKQKEKDKQLKTRLDIKYLLIFFIPLACQQNSAKVNPITIDTTFEEIVIEDQLCDNWQKPNETQVNEIYSLMDTISAFEWNECYGNWNCAIDGEI